MTLHLFNTMGRTKEAFVPADEKRVTMYVCGPTVYSYAHIGNARPAVVFDVLFRVLRHDFGEDHVVYARNITDVDDKINKAAAELGQPISAITEKYTKIYREDAAALNVLPPSLEPTVTGHISDIINMIAKLVDDGHAYEADGHVLFDVKSYADYGKLSGRSLDDMIAGARVEVAPYKRNAHDFVLWKPSKEQEPSWESPFGAGRPGWHIECSAMTEANLGKTIDIHGGGADLQFPHHENEIAQSTCAHGGQLYVRYWLHNGFLAMSGEKMSKSLGNVALIHDLVKDWPGEVLRFALISGHYRAPLDFTDDLLKQAKTTLDRHYNALRRLADVEAANTPDITGVLAALHDDLNTPGALAELSALSTAANTAETDQDKAQAKANLLAAGQLLGLLTADPEAWAKGDGDEAAEIDALVAARVEARAAKNWAEADRIRDELAVQGVEIMDGPEGSSWRRKG